MAARTTGGGAVTLKTLRTEGKKGLRQIGIEQMLDLTELAGAISQGESRFQEGVSRGQDYGLLEPVQYIEKTLPDSLGMTTTEAL